MMYTMYYTYVLYHTITGWTIKQDHVKHRHYVTGVFVMGTGQGWGREDGQ